MNGIQLGGSWGSRVSQARLDEINKAAIDNKGFTLEMSERVTDGLGISDHAGAFKSMQEMAKARQGLIALKDVVVTDKNEHLFIAAFERAATAVENVAKHVHSDYESSFLAHRNSSSDQRTPGGTILVSDIGSQYTFECHFHPNLRGEKFVLKIDSQPDDR